MTVPIEDKIKELREARLAEESERQEAIRDWQLHVNDRCDAMYYVFHQLLDDIEEVTLGEMSEFLRVEEVYPMGMRTPPSPKPFYHFTLAYQSELVAIIHLEYQLPWCERDDGVGLENIRTSYSMYTNRWRLVVRGGSTYHQTLAQALEYLGDPV